MILSENEYDEDPIFNYFFPSREVYESLSRRREELLSTFLDNRGENSDNFNGDNDS